MKQFAFPLSVKCANERESDQCEDLLKSLGYKCDALRGTREIMVTNYMKSCYKYASVSLTNIYNNDRHHIDHFNPELIRDVASACTNDTWQEGELWASSRGKLSRIVGYVGFDVNPNGHRRPTIAEICAHHGYEIKGRDIVKKVETVSNCDKSYCPVGLKLAEKSEDQRILIEQMNELKSKNADLREKIEALTDVNNQELERLRSEKAELKELLRKRPTVFDSSSVSGGYLITFENKEDNCIEIAFCGKGKFEKVLKALHD